MIDGVGQAVTFRGGVAAGLVTATWPFGRLSVGGDRLRISSPIGFRAIDVGRDEVEEVVIRRTPALGIRVEVTTRGGVVSKTAFLPTNPGKVGLALEAHGWPVRVALRRPRTSPAVLLVCGMALLLLGVGEAVIKSSQGDTINRRGIPVETRIESIEGRGGKRYGSVSYSVDSRIYSGKLVLFSDQDLGDQVLIRYDPEKPSRFWKQGDDPRGPTNGSSDRLVSCRASSSSSSGGASAASGATSMDARHHDRLAPRPLRRESRRLGR